MGEGTAGLFGNVGDSYKKRLNVRIFSSLFLLLSVNEKSAEGEWLVLPLLLWPQPPACSSILGQHNEALIPPPWRSRQCYCAECVNCVAVIKLRRGFTSLATDLLNKHFQRRKPSDVHSTTLSSRLHFRLPVQNVPKMSHESMTRY